MLVSTVPPPAPAHLRSGQRKAPGAGLPPRPALPCSRGRSSLPGVAVPLAAAAGTAVALWPLIHWHLAGPHLPHASVISPRFRPCGIAVACIIVFKLALPLLPRRKKRTEGKPAEPFPAYVVIAVHNEDPAVLSQRLRSSCTVEPPPASVTAVDDSDEPGGLEVASQMGAITRRVTDDAVIAHPGEPRQGQRIGAHGQLGAGSSVAIRCILQAMDGPGRRGLLPSVVAQMKRKAPGGTVPPQPRRYPDISRVLATARGSRGPCVGQTVRPPMIFRGPGGLFTEDSGLSKSRSKRFGEPLAWAGFRPYTTCSTSMSAITTPGAATKVTECFCVLPKTNRT